MEKREVRAGGSVGIFETPHEPDVGLVYGPRLLAMARRLEEGSRCSWVVAERKSMVTLYRTFIPDAPSSLRSWKSES